MSIGRAITAATSSKSFILDILKLVLLINVASTSEVAILETSAGWKLTGPRLNQECDPFTSEPTNITATSSTSTIRYDGMDMTSHRRGLKTNRMSVASTSAVSIQTNCLPLLTLKSKMDEGSEEWMDA